MPKVIDISAVNVPLCASALPQELKRHDARDGKFWGRWILGGNVHLKNWGEGRKITTPARPLQPPYPALGKDPYLHGLRAGGLGSLPPPCLAPPDEAGRGAQPARSPTSPCQGGTERAGRVATLTSPSTVTPMRAHVARPELDGPEAAWKSYVDLETRLEAHPADTRAAAGKSPQAIHCHRREFSLAHPTTNATREPRGD